MTRFSPLSAAFLMAGALLMAIPAFAQPPTRTQGPGVDRGHRPDPAQMQARMVKMRGRMLRNRVGLSEAKATEVEKALSSFDSQRMALHQRRRAAMDQARELVTGDVQDDAVYAKVLAELDDIQATMQALRKNQNRALAQVLTAREQLKVRGAMHRMMRRARGHMGRGMRHPGMRGRGMRGQGPQGGGFGGFGGPGCDGSNPGCGRGAGADSAEPPPL